MAAAPVGDYRSGCGPSKLLQNKIRGPPPKKSGAFMGGANLGERGGYELSEDMKNIEESLKRRLLEAQEKRKTEKG